MTPLDHLVALLDLERLEVNLFRGVSPEEHGGQRVFGGQVAAQSLVAATRTLEPAASGQVPQVHSLHAYFLREGDTRVPIVFDVDRIRDGRSFATRRVVAIQHGRAIFNLQASFHVDEDGPEHEAEAPPVPPPEGLPSLDDLLSQLDASRPARGESPIELRYVRERYLLEPVSAVTGRPGPELPVWWRTTGRLPDDPALHACVATYASDLMIMDCAMLPHGLSHYRGNVMSASLDHAMWFHRPFRADEWMLYVLRSPSAAGARGLAIGHMFRGDGTLALTVVQEGLIRRPRRDPAHDEPPDHSRALPHDDPRRDPRDPAAAAGSLPTVAAAPVDLRSDTVTRPTAEMRRAMADAEVGDDHYGEDPSVNRLQEAVAERLGYGAALFVPSGTMANQIALRLLARPGTEVLCAARAHVRQYEAAAAAQNAGVQLRPLADTGGTFTGAAVDAAVVDAGHHLPTVSAVFLENTHMPAGGVPWTAEQIADVVAAACGHGLPTHCDGARILNAAVALGLPPTRLTAGVTTTMTCLSKGLCAPVGSVLAGDPAAIDEAREHRARLGGAMRQAGVLAAAGLVALDRMVERLADDHARARRLAEVLADRFPGSVDPRSVRTNIVCVDARALPPDPVGRLADLDVLVGTIDAGTVRFVLHHDVDDAGMDRAVAALDELAGQVVGARHDGVRVMPALEVVHTVPRCALAVHAHPDDPEISAGGTLARWADAGCEVWILICTRGEKGSPDPDRDPEDLARVRLAETAAAVALLGAKGHLHLDHPDGGIDNTPALRSELVGHVRRLRPDVVVCPDPTAVFFGDSYVNHRDHRVTGWATLDAVAPAASNPHYFPEHPGVHAVSELWLSGTLEPNVAVDISATIDRKVDALFCHASQLTETGDWFRDFLRGRAETEGRAAGLRHAEAFRRLRLT